MAQPYLSNFFLPTLEQNYFQTLQNNQLSQHHQQFSSLSNMNLNQNQQKTFLQSLQKPLQSLQKMLPKMSTNPFKNLDSKF